MTRESSVNQSQTVMVDAKGKGLVGKGWTGTIISTQRRVTCAGGSGRKKAPGFQGLHVQLDLGAVGRQASQDWSRSGPRTAGLAQVQIAR